VKRLIVAVVVAGMAVSAVGCAEEVKKSEPKLSGDSKPDPRLKPAEAGGGGAATSQPQASGALKGD
jgi:hypothetical protein